VEFVHDPLSNGEERPGVELEDGRRLKVDNLRNIVSDKLGAVVSRQEPKDFVDFYFIAKLDPWQVRTLRPRYAAVSFQDSRSFPLSMLFQKDNHFPH
jgi:hypothetical protein